MPAMPEWPETPAFWQRPNSGKTGIAGMPAAVLTLKGDANQNRCHSEPKGRNFIIGHSRS
jgi:hypothetical protein